MARGIGENNVKAKLKPEYMPTIISLRFEFNWPYVDIGMLLGVSRHTIYNICHGRTWTHVTNPLLDKIKAQKNIFRRSKLCRVASRGNARSA